MSSAPRHIRPQLHTGRRVSARLRHALLGRADSLSEFAHATPFDVRDELLTLGEIHDLWMAPLSETRGRERHQLDPSVVTLKSRLESSFLARIGERCDAPRCVDADEAVAMMRRVAALDLVPEVYEWVAGEAGWDDLVRFLSLEGGPDGGFDDLVAVAQVSIRGAPKVALGLNYWDEMGNGDPDAVHTLLHERLAAAAGLVRPDIEVVDLSVLERTILSGVLATNRHLQPELLGALGLLELQAGPRCRAVLRAFDRIGAVPGDVRRFYEVHAEADPRHGKDWLDRVVAPLSQQQGWASAMVRGAMWRQAVNADFFAHMLRLFDPESARHHRRSLAADFAS